MDGWVEARVWWKAWCVSAIELGGLHSVAMGDSISQFMLGSASRLYCSELYMDGIHEGFSFVPFYQLCLATSVIAGEPTKTRRSWCLSVLKDRGTGTVYLPSSLQLGRQPWDLGPSSSSRPTHVSHGLFRPHREKLVVYLYPCWHETGLVSLIATLGSRQVGTISARKYVGDPAALQGFILIITWAIPSFHGVHT